MRIDTPRHRGFYIAIAIGIVAGALTAPFAKGLALVVGVNAFYVAYLVFAAVQLRRSSPDFLRKHADQEDAPAALIFVVMVATVAASASSLFMALLSQGGPKFVPVVLGVTSLTLGWFAVHTLWAIHYAYEYYQSHQGGPISRGDKEKKAIAGGLEFPGGEEPDGTAFVYFSYVVGMTAQTSDTEITSGAMRRIVTAQSVFAYFFNTVMVAAAVNIVVTLAH